MKPLLILRPEPGASATAARAAALGLDVIVRPMFEIVSRAWDAPDPTCFDAIVLTSANAARHGGPDLLRYQNLPAFVVGEATAETARSAGLTDVTVAASSAGQLFCALEQLGLSRALHLAGEDRTAYPHVSLNVTTRIVYTAPALPVVLPAPPYVVVVHSVRAAVHFASLRLTRDAVDVVAISAEVATSLGQGWRSIVTANAPRDDAMLELAVGLCKKAPVRNTGNT